MYDTTHDMTHSVHSRLQRMLYAEDKQLLRFSERFFHCTSDDFDACSTEQSRMLMCPVLLCPISLLSLLHTSSEA